MKFHFVPFSSYSPSFTAWADQVAFISLPADSFLCWGQTCLWSRIYLLCFHMIFGILSLRCRSVCRSLFHCLIYRSIACWSCSGRTQSRWSHVCLGYTSQLFVGLYCMLWAGQWKVLRPGFPDFCIHSANCSINHVWIGPWRFQR